MFWKGGRRHKALCLFACGAFLANARSDSRNVFAAPSPGEEPRFPLGAPLIEGSRALQNLQFALLVLPHLVNRCLDNAVCVGSAESLLLSLKSGLSNYQLPFVRHSNLSEGFCAVRREAFYSEARWEAPIEVCLPKLVDPISGLPRWNLQDAVVEIAELMLVKSGASAESGSSSEMATHLAELTGYRFIERWNHQPGFEHFRTLSLELLEDSQLFKIFVSSGAALWDLTPVFLSMPLCTEPHRVRSFDLKVAHWLFGRFVNENRGEAVGSLGLVAHCLSPTGNVDRQQAMGYWTVAFDLVEGYEVSNVEVSADFKNLSPGNGP